MTEVVGYFGPIADELSTRAEEALYEAIAEGARHATRYAKPAVRSRHDSTVEGAKALSGGRCR